MNSKIVALVALVMGLVLVPLVAAAPLLQQQRIQDQDMLQTQDQDRLQTKDCTCTYARDGTEDGAQLQTQVQENLQTCNQQQLRTRDCTCTCNGDGEGSALQNRTRLCEGYGYDATNGNLNMEQYNCQSRYRHQNQAP